jgi:hypothetical protein
MPPKQSKTKRQTIRSAHWKRSTTIPQDKYDSVARAILQSLGARRMRWGELVDRVEGKLPNFSGSVWWYTTVCLRELETQGKVLREPGPPVFYSKKSKKRVLSRR